MSLILILVSKRDWFFRPRKFSVPFFMIIGQWMGRCGEGSVIDALWSTGKSEVKQQVWAKVSRQVHLTPVICLVTTFRDRRRKWSWPRPLSFLRASLFSYTPNRWGLSSPFQDIPAQISPDLLFNFAPLMLTKLSPLSLHRPEMIIINISKHWGLSLYLLGRSGWLWFHFGRNIRPVNTKHRHSQEHSLTLQHPHKKGHRTAVLTSNRK